MAIDPFIITLLYSLMYKRQLPKKHTANRHCLGIEPHTWPPPPPTRHWVALLPFYWNFLNALSLLVWPLGFPLQSRDVNKHVQQALGEHLDDNFDSHGLISLVTLFCAVGAAHWGSVDPAFVISILALLVLPWDLAALFPSLAASWSRYLSLIIFTLRAFAQQCGCQHHLQSWFHHISGLLTLSVPHQV